MRRQSWHLWNTIMKRETKKTQSLARARKYVVFCRSVQRAWVSGYRQPYAILHSKTCLKFKNKDGWVVVRSFLKYLFMNSLINVDYSTIVPYYKRGFKLPVSYTELEIQKVEASIDRNVSIMYSHWQMAFLHTCNQKKAALHRNPPLEKWSAIVWTRKHSCESFWRIVMSRWQIIAERNIRLFTVGRNNWFQVDTVSRAKASAIAYSIA